jgi:hypothetical protein
MPDLTTYMSTIYHVGKIQIRSSLAKDGLQAYVSMLSIHSMQLFGVAKNA